MFESLERPGTVVLTVANAESSRAIVEATIDPASDRALQRRFALVRALQPSFGGRGVEVVRLVVPARGIASSMAPPSRAMACVVVRPSQRDEETRVGRGRASSAVMRRVASLVLLWVAAGCEGVARMPPARGGLDAGVVAPVDTTFWLHQSEPLELPEMSWTLPVSAGPRLHVTTARGEVLVGGADGLHQLLADGGSQELHPGEVTGLATLPSGDALVLKPSGAFVRTGTLLRPNELSMSLPPSASLLRSEGSRLWFSTPAAIVRLDGASLTSFSVPAVGSLQGPVAGVMVAQAGDRLLALRERGASIELQSLSDEVSIVRAVPLRNGAFLASDESGLVSCREVQDGGALWRAVWVGDADAGAPLHGELLGVDPESGAAWLRVDGGLARLDEDRLAARPMESFTAFAVDTNGAVLLRTATGVVRLGSEAPVRFSDQVRPLSQARCVSCHRQSGVALPVLETAAQWREHIDTILLRVSPTIAEGLRMPRGDSALLEADLTRLRRWKQEGFRP